MVVRQIKRNRWEQVYREIITFGRAAPLSLQFDIEISCNGADYILKVQPDGVGRVVALQAGPRPFELRRYIQKRLFSNRG